MSSFDSNSFFGEAFIEFKTYELFSAFGDLDLYLLENVGLLRVDFQSALISWDPNPFIKLIAFLLLLEFLDV